MPSLGHQLLFVVFCYPRIVLSSHLGKQPFTIVNQGRQMPGTVFSAREMSTAYLLHEGLGEGSRCSLNLDQVPVVHSGYAFTEVCSPRKVGSLLP